MNDFINALLEEGKQSKNMFLKPPIKDTQVKWVSILKHNDKYVLHPVTQTLHETDLCGSKFVIMWKLVFFMVHLSPIGTYD